MLEKSIKLFNTFIQRQYLPSAESLRALPLKTAASFQPATEVHVFYRIGVWVVVSAIAESRRALSAVVFHQEQALSWRHSRCLKTDRSENWNRAPGCVVLCVPSGIAMSETTIQLFCFRKNPRNLQRRWRLRGQKECTEKFMHSSTLTKSKRVRACAHLCRLGGSLGFWWQGSIHL